MLLLNVAKQKAAGVTEGPRCRWVVVHMDVVGRGKHDEGKDGISQGTSDGTAVLVKFGLVLE